jgi:hypothetical protein
MESAMSKVDFERHIEEQINRVGQKLHVSRSAKLDDLAFGQMGFYLALRRVLQGTSTAEDLGLMDAVNDVLQTLKLLDSDETFLKSVQG